MRNKFATVSKWIHDGQAVTITKQGIPFATLAPARRKKAPPPPVDRLARLHRLFPDGPVKGDVQAVIDDDRGQT